MDDRANRLGLEPLLGVAELAEYLGVPAQRIYDWRLTGVGPRGYRLGRELKFPVSEVTRWLAERDERTGSAGSTYGEVQR
ncbi:helix-turn-helix transcriptional regulator [uncultured Amnibacterium sp.]|uniref:helix-turn-helix transcriptional regulator n=1 Tax=uncultured Amnibacterium sp. TaxID=1631851 RepID=UPI0035C9C1F4